MAALRRNVLADPAVRDAYVTGVLSLKSEFLGPTTSDFGIPGTVQQVSTYDLFTVWHHLAMGRMTPPTKMTGTPLIAAQYSCPGTA
jgi:tyrosinase